MNEKHQLEQYTQQQLIDFIQTYEIKLSAEFLIGLLNDDAELTKYRLSAGCFANPELETFCNVDEKKFDQLIKDKKNNNVFQETIQVDSDNISKVSYYFHCKVLEVKFIHNGAVFQYSNVPHNVYKDFRNVLKNGESIGDYFNKNIKDEYMYVRIYM